MELFIPPPDVAHAGLRALKTIAMADGTFHALEQRLLESVRTHVLHTAVELASLTPISGHELAATVGPGAASTRILDGCMIMALIDGEASAAEGALLEHYAHSLQVSSHALHDVQRLIARHLRVARIDIIRRSFIGQRARAYLADNGLTGITRVAGALLGIENRGLAARYRALEQTPRGTLGREYFEFIRAHHFALPGEKDAAPEIVVFHDCLHVLAGYGTSSPEETQIASFQAGILRQDPVFGLLFMLAQFQLGVQITPVTAAERLVADPDRMLQAFVRGTKVSRDLCVDWTPQQDFERSIDELRVSYNIVPRA